MAPPTNKKRVVAAVHAAPVFMDTDATIATKVVGFIEKAGKEKINLLVFPELYVPGYPYFLMCYSPMEVMGPASLYVDASIEVPGPEITLVQASCKRAGVAVVMGISERVASTRQCFISQVFIEEDGSILGVHRKLQPTYMEHMIFGQGGGATLKVFDTSSGRVGGLCCFEHTMNLARQEMIAQGEQIHAAAWPGVSFIKTGLDSFNDTQIDAMMKTHALTAQCFVIAAGLPIDQTCLDWMEANLGPQKMVLLGGGWSAVIHPINHYLSGPHTGLEERFLVAEIDLNDINKLKILVNSAGNYARPEVVRLHVDRRPLRRDEETSMGSPAPVTTCDQDPEQTQK